MRKLFRESVTALLATSLLLGASINVIAAETNQNGDTTLGTEFSYEMKNDPTYTVTIPSSVAIDKDGSQVEITASNVANLDSQKVSVTIAGTNYYRNQMVLEGKDENGRNSVMRYQIITEDGETIETTGNDTATGKELASFTENGTAEYTVKPIVLPSTKTNVSYTGSMTYGIALVDAE